MAEQRKVASTDLRLDEPGTLHRPGPLGRLARLIFGLLCLYYVYGLIMLAANIMSPGDTIPALVWNGLIPGLFLVSYVVNIGYSRAWRKWPAIVSAAAFAVVAAFGYLNSGSFETVALARLIWAWELYVFGHLGFSFMISAVIGTLGCEMRAMHDLYSRVTGVPTKEHFCPIGPLNHIDRWEARNRRG
ncbi:MAG: hypothetical protein KJO82_12500 [Gammaproteobacteria bacterium]|nr:hypothetical protein [Gammaproteobacteria bacterium]